MTRNRNADIDRHGLNYVMQFDHVIQVHADGTVTDAPQDTRASWAPEFNGDSATGTAELDGDGWAIMSNGYTGQQGGGNVMHNSESIGAGLERDILATPGFYVAVVCTWTPEDDDDNAESVIEGWAVAYRESI